MASLIHRCQNNLGLTSLYNLQRAFVLWRHGTMQLTSTLIHKRRQLEYKLNIKESGGIRGVEKRINFVIHSTDQSPTWKLNVLISGEEQQPSSNVAKLVLI